jgi:hypothetical protein
MGVKIEYLFHKDMSFAEMIPKIAEAYRLVAVDSKELDLPAIEVRAPLPFLERVLQTNSMTVIRNAVEDLLKVLHTVEHMSTEDLRNLAQISNAEDLDEVDSIAKNMVTEIKRSLVVEVPKELQRKHVLFDESRNFFSYRNALAQAERQRFDDLLASRKAAKSLLMQNPEPTPTDELIKELEKKETDIKGVIVDRPDHVFDPYLTEQIASQKYEKK